MPRSVIIDTDAGSDDLMAIAFLLSRPDIRVEAITVVNGTAHVLQGGKNILRLLALAGAFVYYLNWSSEAALSEFMATGNPPLQAAKDHPSCRRSA